ncbi:hypothetical protein C2I36_11520 [Rhodobacteraceae bacterium WD3A24]|nr:hypothetical protein C2I36_11520 [Rhodobacteraceae bacterium WD3A24]
MIRGLPLFAAGVGILALAACEPTAQNQRTRTGAATGAFLGGLFGAAAADDDDRLAGAAVGAGVGAAVGGIIGQRLDQQANALRNDLGNDQVNIRNTGSELIVTMPQDILFATDSAAVRPDLQGDLRVIAANLRDYPNSDIRVVGHTDSTGSASYNQSLSERRADSVARVLMGAGVDPGRVRAIGRGEDDPVASNLTPEGRAQNRRVEIIIVPHAR